MSIDASGTSALGTLTRQDVSTQPKLVHHERQAQAAKEFARSLAAALRAMFSQKVYELLESNSQVLQTRSGTKSLDLDSMVSTIVGQNSRGLTEILASILSNRIDSYVVDERSVDELVARIAGKLQLALPAQSRSSENHSPGSLSSTGKKMWQNFVNLWNRLRDA
jgi:hypothetical protein